MAQVKVAWRPNNGPQTAFLASTAREVLYGGAVAGGKTDALLVCDLRWVDHPLHRSIYLRRTRPQLQEAIDRSLVLYPQIAPGAVWQEGKSRWEMPSGAIYQFGYAEHELDIMNYKSFEYNVVKFDELTSFTERQYTFMFLRNRSKSADLPLWIRSGTNPGDVGHEFVFKRFVENRTPYEVYPIEVELPDKRKVVVSRQFIPSNIWDNPALPNRDDYVANVMLMSEDDVKAYLYGQWIALAGSMFKVPPVEIDKNELLSSDYYVIRAIDYGWDDYTCVLWLVVYNDCDVVDIVGEIYVRETTIEGIANYIKGMEKQLQIKAPMYSIGSPEMGKIEGTSTKSLETMFQVNGVFVQPSKSSPGSRKAGWAQVQKWLPKLRVWPGGASNLLRTLPKLMRDVRNPDDIKKGQEDHGADTLRYGVMAITDKPTPIVIAQEYKDPSKFDTKFDRIVKELQKPQTTLSW